MPTWRRRTPRPDLPRRKGGDLGIYTRGENWQSSWQDATFALLQAGQSTEPIRTRQGYVILKVTEHTPGGTQPFAGVDHARKWKRRPSCPRCSRGCAPAYLGEAAAGTRISMCTSRLCRHSRGTQIRIQAALQRLHRAAGTEEEGALQSRSRYTGAHRGRHAGDNGGGGEYNRNEQPGQNTTATEGTAEGATPRQLPLAQRRWWPLLRR